MGGGAGRKSTKKPEEGDCVTLRWLGDHAHCTRCKEKRWRTPCQSKHHWAKLDPAEREKYRRGAAVVEIERSETRASAEVASEVIAKQLADEKLDDPAPVKRQTQKQLHGEELHEQLGMFMLFAPRFHAELQLSIERAWATSKGGVREKCDYTITTLRKNIEPSLDDIPVELFRKWQRTEQQWEEAYRTGATQINVEGRVQQIKKTLYASHRVAPAAPPPPKSRKRSIGQISKMAHQQHVVLDDDFEKAPERKHKQWVKEMKLLYEKDDGTVHRLVDVAWCDDCADGEGGVESAMIGWTYECESWSSHMPSRCGKLDYSRCYPYPITDVEQMVEDYAEAKAAGKLPWE